MEPRFDPAPPPWVTPVTLEGERVRLEPLSPDHLAGLAEVAFDAAIWRWTIARPTAHAGLEAWLTAALENQAAGTESPFAAIDRATGRPIGSSRFLNISPESRRLEIGWTWLATAAQRTGANREVKLLQLTHCFEALQANRVEFKTDSRNERSRAALLGIGAQFEGIFRNHVIMPDGPLRHSAWYSVTIEDWPEVKARLETLLRTGGAGGAGARALRAQRRAGDRGAAMTAVRTVRTADYHTGGEPFRIVVDGIPNIPGQTVLERRRWVHDNLDEVRHLLIDEPRGHADMYGCFVVPPNDDGADIGVIFFHNEGYSTACGHGTIALVTWALETGRLRATTTGIETHVTVDVPSGRLTCVARHEPDDEAPGSPPRVEAVRFRNVPSFVLASAVMAPTNRGDVSVDVAYGGAFYGSVDARAVGLDVSPASLPALIALQRELRPALESTLDVVHPDEPELSGIYGVIFWQAEPDETGADLVQRNVTVFADGEVDRSPCGSGTSARLALLDASGALPRGAVLRHRSIVDSVFHGKVVGDGSPVGGYPSVITEIEGSAFRTGTHEFTLDPRDPLRTGFLLR